MLLVPVGREADLSRMVGLPGPPLGQPPLGGEADLSWTDGIYDPWMGEKGADGKAYYRLDECSLSLWVTPQDPKPGGASSALHNALPSTGRSVAGGVWQNTETKGADDGWGLVGIALGLYHNG